MTFAPDRRTLLRAGVAIGTAAAAAPLGAAPPQDGAILPLLEHSAKAQISALEAQAGDRPAGFRLYSANWIFATFLVGVARLARVSSDPAFARYLWFIGDVFNHGMRGDGSPINLINADDQAIGDTYLELYAHRRNPGLILPLKQRLDFTAPYLTMTPEPRRLVWWWCDALYMAPPVFARMSNLTGDPRYLQAADTQWWRTHARLWDEEDQLFYRDARFITRRADSGAKIVWARGNGWVLGALARMFEAMPADFASRPRYLNLYRRMARSIVKLQQPDGLWRASLLDPKSFPETETSGAALFTYALAFGINHGLLDRRTFEPHVRRGWAGLVAKLRPDGILGYVQRAGDRPVPTRSEDTAPYASGAFLLAGLEVMRLGGPPAPLPVAEPRPDPSFGAPQPAPPPTPQTPEEAAENVRRDDEHKGVRDLAYDPVTDDPHWRPLLP